MTYQVLLIWINRINIIDEEELHFMYSLLSPDTTKAEQQCIKQELLALPVISPVYNCSYSHVVYSLLTFPKKTLLFVCY